MFCDIVMPESVKCLIKPKFRIGLCHVRKLDLVESDETRRKKNESQSKYEVRFFRLTFLMRLLRKTR